MRLLLLGATGVLGRRALPVLVAAGHEVVAAVRDERGARAVTSGGARAVRADILDARAMRAAADGAQVVVNVASAIPARPHPSPEDWERNDRVRREGTSNVLSAAAQAGVEHYVHTSVYLVYGDDAGETPVTESAPLRPAPVIQSAVDGEAAVRAGAAPAWTIIRPGWLYDNGAWHTGELLRQLRAGEAVVLEGAPAWRSPVHALDVARAIEAVVTRCPAGEVFNVADDCPVRSRELLDGLAERLGAPRPQRITAEFAQARLGPAAAAGLRRSVPLATGRIRERLGFAPMYPTWRAGFEAVITGALTPRAHPPA